MTQPRLYSSSVRESALRKTQQVRRQRTIDVKKAPDFSGASRLDFITPVELPFRS